MPDDHIITASYPSTEEHIHLRTISGLVPPPPSAVPHALANSLQCFTARTSTGEAIGMVRLIGDGSLFLQIVDMCVHPDHQGKGLGGKLLDEMVKWVDENAPWAYTSLIGDAPGQRLYRSRGFQATKGIGMMRSKW